MCILFVKFYQLCFASRRNSPSDTTIQYKLHKFMKIACEYLQFTNGTYKRYHKIEKVTINVYHTIVRYTTVWDISGTILKNCGIWNYNKYNK